ncbi:MAG: hypothetical protein HY815_32685, partial [Candidatus Riflebacteria bacterium]|nr:hypothetical protein [Candidatus Riflebacteria bacterium]
APKGRYSVYALPLKVGQNQIQVYAERAGQKSEMVARVVTCTPPPPQTPQIDLPAEHATVQLPISGQADRGCDVFIKVNDGAPVKVTATNGKFNTTLTLSKANQGKNRISYWAARGAEESDRGDAVVTFVERIDPPTLASDLPGTSSTPRLSVSGEAAPGTNVVFQVNGRTAFNKKAARGTFSGQLQLAAGANTVTFWAALGSVRSQEQTREVVYEGPAAPPTPSPEPPTREPPTTRPRPPVRPTDVPESVAPPTQRPAAAWTDCASSAVSVPKGGGQWVPLPPGSQFQISVTGDDTFNVFITPGDGPTAYQGWFNGGAASVQIRGRSSNARSHSMTFSNRDGGEYFLIFDNANYPQGGMAMSDISVNYSIKCK